MRPAPPRHHPTLRPALGVFLTVEQLPGRIFTRETRFPVCTGAAAETGGVGGRGCLQPRLHAPYPEAAASHARTPRAPPATCPPPAHCRPRTGCSPASRATFFSGQGHSLAGSHRGLLWPPLCRLHSWLCPNLRRKKLRDRARPHPTDPAQELDLARRLRCPPMV